MEIPSLEMQLTQKLHALKRMIDPGAMEMQQ